MLVGDDWERPLWAKPLNPGNKFGLTRSELTWEEKLSGGILLLGAADDRAPTG